MNETIEITTIAQSHHLDIKRDDLLHPQVSGNKFRKLKYTLREAKNQNAKTLLTFGGAFSNHIAAVATAGKLYSFQTIGVIRGEELEAKISSNPTLSFAKSQGMHLHFVTREQYKDKESPIFLYTLNQQFGKFYGIPEGGTNDLAIKGCAEILTPQDLSYDYICVSVGTGGTMAGIVASAAPHQHVLGFSALKGTFQEKLITKYSSSQNFSILDDYCFGGYAKIDFKLIRFINEFKNNHGVQLDPIYTGKMFYGILDLLKNGYFRKNSRILAVHTGGLQGIAGMNEKLKKKNLPTIDV